MKRLYIIIIGVICLCMPMQAQNFGQRISRGFQNFFSLINQHTQPTGIHDPWDLYVGPRLGIDVATMTSIGGKPVVGPTGGGFFEVFILKNLSIEMGLNYSWQGCNDVKYTMNRIANDGTTTTTHATYDYSLHYINTDYLCRWYPIAAKPLSIYSGLHLARLFKAKTSGYSNSNIRDDLHRGDIALPIGASYEWGQWQVDLRYDHTLRHIGKSGRAKQLLDNTNNVLLQMTVAYKILLW